MSTLQSCIDSVRRQTYRDIEIIVVDSSSTDGTVSYCKENNISLINVEWKLLGARSAGFQKSSGDFVFMLDADQILESTCIQRCLDVIDEYDMLCLEEKTFETRTFIQRAFEADRRLIHQQQDLQFDPVFGTLLARFYRKELLKKVFDAIPNELLPFVVAHDHAIIYWEAWQYSNKVGMIPNAIWHREPASILELWRKNRRYGKTTRELVKTGHYSELIKKKTRFRKAKGQSSARMLSSILLLLKAPAYLIGYYFG